MTYWNIFGNGLAGKRKASGEKHYYIKDHLGSTRLVVNDQGTGAATIMESHDYYPFGLLMPMRSYTTGEEAKEKFTGKELDGETGWYYHGARFRNPVMGPWLSADPLASNDLSISPYHYAHNNPINIFDPDGKEDW